VTENDVIVVKYCDILPACLAHPDIQRPSPAPTVYWYDPHPARKGRRKDIDQMKQIGDLGLRDVVGQQQQLEVVTRLSR
jgi:hypothetical protein